MRNNPDMDSNMALALGLLGATIVAAFMVLILPAVVGNLETEALPAPQVIATSDKALSDTAGGLQQLPKAQRPPDTLLEAAPAPRRTIASSR